MSSQKTTLSMDSQLDALADSERREILYTLCDTDPDGDSLDHAVRECSDPIALRHVHLPKLDSKGIIDWDRDASTIRRGPAFGELRPLLGFLEGYHTGVEA